MATNCRRPQTEKEVEQGKEELEMIAPPLKRFCSSVVSGVRKIAVEGNIGKLAVSLAWRHLSRCVCSHWQDHVPSPPGREKSVLSRGV